MMIRKLLCAGLAIFLVACSSDEPASDVEITAMHLHDEAVGHYCNMLLSEHSGPQAQIHIESQSEPLWFSQVRDAVAFTRLPEETATVSAIFVNDMAVAPSWDTPGKDNWIAVDTARFVIGSKAVGGMGAPEAIPFGSDAAAEAFIAENGGEVVGFSGISDEYVLAPVATMHPGDEHQTTMSHNKGHSMPTADTDADDTSLQNTTMQPGAEQQENTMNEMHKHE